MFVRLILRTPNDREIRSFQFTKHMDQKDLAQIELELTEALETFNWKIAEESCRKLIDIIYEQQEAFSEAAAKRLLSKLRRKRQFYLMSLLAESIIRSGQTDSEILRQYSQSLIDQGILRAAEIVLQSIIQNPDSRENEITEAYGLTGRIYKQLYTEITGNNKQRKQLFLEQGINAYLSGYRLNLRNYWHAINIVALLKRGQRDGLVIQGMPDPEQLAEEVLNILKMRAEESGGTLRDPWEIATNLEALIALNRYEEAEAKAFEYSLALDANAFELNSTLRQLTEVWQLNKSGQTGLQILSILTNAFHLKSAGGVLNLTAAEASQEIENISRIKSGFENNGGFEKVFGSDKTQTLDWYKTGLERTCAVARIETASGRPVGTGWLVNSKDFFPASSGLLLLTNAHVVSTDPNDQAYPPHRVRANFQAINKVYEFGGIEWLDSRDNLDAAFLTIKGDPPVDPLPINDNPPIKLSEPSSRVYIIGHPGGRALEISLHDSRLVGCNETFLHYRTPTEGGSSGSPVFDHEYWEVIALHHRGKSDMPRLDGKKGVYEANEGITVLAIKKAIESGI
jgi:V8-like Glu-specific endopeptidase